MLASHHIGTILQPPSSHSSISHRPARLSDPSERRLGTDAGEWSASGRQLTTSSGGWMEAWFGFHLQTSLPGPLEYNCLLIGYWLQGTIIFKNVYIFNVSSQEDIRNYSSLYKLCEGVDCIFHTASYGMSGPEQVTWRTKWPHWF